MLDVSQIGENKTRYLELLSKLDEDTSKFVYYLNSPRVDFFNKPFNNKPDVAYAGSLCEHCVKFYDELKKITDFYRPNYYSEKELIKVALFKDLYRAELYEAYNRNQKNDETGKWETVVGYRAKEERPVFGDIGFSSYMIARKFFNLDDDEVVEAIVNSTMESELDSYQIRKAYSLVPFVLMAELALTYLQETEE